MIEVVEEEDEELVVDEDEEELVFDEDEEELVVEDDDDDDDEVVVVVVDDEVVVVVVVVPCGRFGSFTRAKSRFSPPGLEKTLTKPIFNPGSCCLCCKRKKTIP